MFLVIVGIVALALIGVTVWSTRRTRRRLLGGAARPTGAASPTPDPTGAANELRATIDAMNGRGSL